MLCAFYLSLKRSDDSFKVILISLRGTKNGDTRKLLRTRNLKIITMQLKGEIRPIYEQPEGALIYTL